MPAPCPACGFAPAADQVESFDQPDGVGDVVSVCLLCGAVFVGDRELTGAELLDLGPRAVGCIGGARDRYLSRGVARN